MGPSTRERWNEASLWCFFFFYSFFATNDWEWLRMNENEWMKCDIGGDWKLTFKMAETGGREAQRNNMNTATPGDSSTANPGSNNRQNGQQTSPQTPWNPASYYMFLQSYYQSYYYQLAYYSQLYNWQLLTSSQPGLLAGSSDSITAAGTQPLVGQNVTPQNNQQAPVQTTGLLARNQPQAGTGNFIRFILFQVRVFALRKSRSFWELLQNIPRFRGFFLPGY